ncbi:DUF3810 domain-containing protein [Marasmitruncus massiliensis]|uniref:DUF3810 domain-containing protein n=1 Tax=Marasmitruncus massiliensis TaxID=1944642 RepID=UPI0015E11E4E|nr:DUF3810 domain-containing protein [Marasmitruncus massiliensis]
MNVQAGEKHLIHIFFRRWWPLLLALVSFLFVFIARSDPGLVERYYSTGFYPVMENLFGTLVSLLPFSLAEFFICTAIVLLPTLLLLAAFRKIQIPWRRLPGWGLKLACCVLFAFVLLCGLNYYRPEFTTFSGLAVRDSSSEELSALCSELIQRANELRNDVRLDETGVMMLSQNSRATAIIARDSFARLAEDYAVLPNMNITPKPLVNSWWMSMMQLTGVFTPYTFEANVNVACPDYSIPATMCHELAHTRGFMREDEANFIGYLACERSDSPDFRYSGVMLALIHSLNRLASDDWELFTQVNDLLSDGVRQDFQYNNAYWARYEGPVAKVSDAVNNAYLQVNAQSDGVQSYGRMVDLLLADYRARHTLSI